MWVKSQVLEKFQVVAVSRSTIVQQSERRSHIQPGWSVQLTFVLSPSAALQRMLSHRGTGTVHTMTTSSIPFRQSILNRSKMSRRISFAVFLALLAGRPSAVSSSEDNCDVGTAEEDCIAADTNNEVSTRQSGQAMYATFSSW